MIRPDEKDGGPVRDYYRRNFLSLLSAVGDLYDDLLTESETSYISRYRGLSTDSQCLYARLISRIGPIFRNDKIHYDEISDIPVAAEELSSHELLLVNGDYTSAEILSMLLKSEIVEMVGALELPVENPGRLKKTELIDAIVALEDTGSISNYRKQLFTTYEPLELENLQVIKLLFFGNFRQDLTEFIITDLGIVTYENYSLEKNARPFQDRRTIDERIVLHDMADELFEILKELDTEGILEYASHLFELVPDPAHDQQIQRRFDRICVDLGRQLERLEAGEQALGIYAKAQLPPSRERQARIHFSRESYAESERICLEIAEEPLNDEETVFAETFLRKIDKKKGAVGRPNGMATVEYQDFKLPVGTPQSVEEYALAGFTDSGYTGHFTENQLWNALYGLAFWDIIFLPIPGVFYNRYQRAPADIHTEQFYRNRRRNIDKRLEDISQNTRWAKKMVAIYDEKCGVACALVNWRRISREMVKTAVTRIPRAHLVAIFARMSLDLHANSSGFPDLIVYPPRRAGRSFKESSGFAHRGDIGKPYVLVEVKGPGDQVQKNQKRWMVYFDTNEIPCRVFRMSAANLAQ